MADTAYLSARVPEMLKHDFKAAAAQKGMKVQELLELVVRDYLKQQHKVVPNRTRILNNLKSQKAELESIGIAHLYLFGSVARDEAHSDSDIDIAADFNGKTPGLIKMGRIEDQLRSAMGNKYKVDLVPLEQMREEVANEAKSDMVQVF